MATKKSDKDERATWVVVQGIALAWGLAFIIGGFFIKPKGWDEPGNNINKQFLWDRLHPFTAGDLIGFLILMAGLITISAIWIRWFGYQYNEVGSVKWNLIPIGLILLGSLLCWNL